MCSSNRRCGIRSISRETGRKLGINTDARYRFERGVDPAFMLAGLELATRMVLELCGGEASQIVLAGAIPDRRAHDRFSVERSQAPHRPRRLDDIAARTILERLGFSVSSEDRFAKVIAPSWRPDIEGKADLVEEIMRIGGVDRVPSTPLPRASSRQC